MLFSPNSTLQKERTSTERWHKMKAGICICFSQTLNSLSPWPWGNLWSFLQQLLQLRCFRCFRLYYRCFCDLCFEVFYVIKMDMNIHKIDHILCLVVKRSFVFARFVSEITLISTGIELYLCCELYRCDCLWLSFWRRLGDAWIWVQIAPLEILLHWSL